MAQILAGDIRKGVTFEYKSGVYTVTDFQHVKPGKGAAFVRCTLKNVVTGQVLSNETFNPDHASAVASGDLCGGKHCADLEFHGTGYAPHVRRDKRDSGADLQRDQ